MLVPIRNMGDVGVVTDSPPYSLPPNAVTGGKNVMFRDGKAMKALGNKLITYFTAGGAASWFETWQPSAGTYKQAIAFADGTIQVWDGAAKSSPTIQDQGGGATTLSASDAWQSTVFGKFCVLNNRSNIPVYSWNSGTSLPDGSVFRMIPGWGAANSPSGAVKAVRAHKNFLVAGGVAAAPYTVYWSDAATTDSFPQSWDYSSTTNLAGFVDVSTADGPIVDIQELMDYMVVYTEKATYALQYVGGTDVFALRKLFGSGIINRECAVQFQGRHLCVSGNKIFVHDGVNIEYPAERRVEQQFFSEASRASRILTAVSVDRSEVWIYYTSGATDQACNRALIFNYVANTWQFIDLPGYCKIAPSNRIYAAPTIGSLTGSIGDLTGTIGDWLTTGARQELTGLCGTGAAVDTGLYTLNTTWRVGANAYHAYIERTGIDLDEIRNQSTTSTHIRSITPQIVGSSTVDVQVGSQRSPGDGVSWGDVKTLDLANGAKYKIDTRKTGRYLAYRIGTWTGTARTGGWELAGMDIDVMDGGR